MKKAIWSLFLAFGSLTLLAEDSWRKVSDAWVRLDGGPVINLVDYDTSQAAAKVLQPPCTTSGPPTWRDLCKETMEALASSLSDLPSPSASDTVFVMHSSVLRTAALSALPAGTIANDAVTLNMINDIADQRLLGNSTGGAASPAEVSLSTAAGYQGLGWTGTNSFGLNIDGLTIDTTPDATTTYVPVRLTVNNRKLLMTDFVKAAINGATEDTSPDSTADFVGTYDTSAAALKKVKPATMLSASTSGATEDTTPDGTADFLPEYDASASGLKKVKINTVVQEGINDSTELTAGVQPMTDKFPVYDGSASALRHVTIKDMYQGDSMVGPCYSDFLMGGSGNIADCGVAGNSNGTNAGFTVGTPELNHPGVWECDLGTTTTGNCGWYASQQVGFILGGGATYFKSILELVTLSATDHDYIMYTGFEDNFTGVPVDFVGFRYNDGVNSGNFECVQRSNGSETTADSTINAQTGTWYKFEFSVNAAASAVTYKINDVTVCGSIAATNIPSGTGRTFNLSPANFVSTAGTTDNQLVAQMDYFYFVQELTTAR